MDILHRQNRASEREKDNRHFGEFDRKLLFGPGVLYTVDFYATGVAVRLARSERVHRVRVCRGQRVLRFPPVRVV